jgi:hypothetical protein
VELLKSKITRSSALKSNISLGDSGIGEKRKRPQNQEKVKKSKDFHIDDPSEASIIPMSSLDAMLSSPLSSLTTPTVIDVGFWNSKDAKNLFGVKEGETTLQALDNQIELLKLANRGDTPYLLVLISDEEEEEIQEMISSNQKHLLRQKCTLLSYALTLAKERMGKVEKR